LRRLHVEWRVGVLILLFMGELVSLLSMADFGFPFKLSGGFIDSVFGVWDLRQVILHVDFFLT